MTFLKLPEVKKRVRLGAASIYKKMKNGTFPKSVKLSERAVAWVESEIDDWEAEKTAARDNEQSEEAPVQRVRQNQGLKVSERHDKEHVPLNRSEPPQNNTEDQSVEEAVKSKEMGLATMAIGYLARIERDAPYRDEALKEVVDWIKQNA